VARTASVLTEELDERHEALAHCLQKLHSRDRELVLTRYEPDARVEEAARRTGRSMEAAYKALSRIRKSLLDCVTHQLTADHSA
jgi:RNA polymerase sigma-70 factor, ECF subfamily